MNSRIPTVSIGMPVYNGAKYIREALDSLLAQTFTDFELIISDNASTDATQEICQEYAEQDSRIRYIRQSTNMGAMPNFTFVLDEARAEYFMWVAHDDKWSLNWLAELLAAHNDSVVLTFGEVVAVNENDEVIRYCRNLSFVGGLILRSLKYAFQDGFEGKANLFYGLFKTKEIIGVLKNEQSGTGYALDALIIFSVLQKGEILAVSSAQLRKRCGGDGDKEIKNHTLIRRITAFYLISYYFNYAQRASTFFLKCMLCASMPLFLVHAHLARLRRFIGRLLTNKGLI
jgi:glycosyltransferase involved in cell wall biosynthesis